MSGDCWKMTGEGTDEIWQVSVMLCVNLAGEVGPVGVLGDVDVRTLAASICVVRRLNSSSLMRS